MSPAAFHGGPQRKRLLKALAIVNQQREENGPTLLVDRIEKRKEKNLLFGAPPSEIHVHDVVDAVSLLLLLNGLS